MWWKYAVSALTAAGLLLISDAARGQWPERGLTLVSSPPASLPWSDEPDPQLTILKELLPRISRELGVPITLAERPGGQEILSANLVAEAKPDGYVFGALDADPVIAWEIQGYTPYIKNEFTPVAVAWRVVYAIVVPAEAPAADLLEMGKSGGRPRLAHTGLEPVSISTLMAMEAAEAAGFEWTLEKVERLDPDLLLQGRAEAMVLPMSSFKVHPEADRFKVLTVLSNAYAPCVGDRPTLESQGLEIGLSPLMTFYLPNKVNWRTRSHLSTALNNALRQPAVVRRLSEACLIPYIEDMEGAIDATGRQYAREEARLEALGFTAADLK